MGSQAINFDSPLQQATTVNVPAGVSFDAPLSKPTSVPVPASIGVRGTPASAQPAPQTYTPTATVRATPGSMPNDSLGQKLSLWSQNVASDLRHGTDITGVGRVMKALGAHGFDSGVSPETADFMGSLPLGLLRATKGAGEVTQPGQHVQGAKDVGLGILDASTIPGSFVSPEAGELAGQGADAALGQAGRAARAVSHTVSSAKGSFDVSSIQPEFQQAVRQVVSKVAQDAGVTPAPSASIRDIAGQVADAVLQRSKATYQSLDSATQGRFQRFDDALRNLNAKIRETAGLDDEQEAALLGQKWKVEQAQQDIFEQAKQAGIDPKLIDSARADYRQGQALFDLDNQLKMSTTGMRPELAKPGSTPEMLDPKKVFARLNKLYDSGRLQEGAGSHAPELLQQADTAFLHQSKIAQRQAALKTAGKIAGTGAAIEGVRSAQHLMSSSNPQQ